MERWNCQSAQYFFDSLPTSLDEAVGVANQNSAILLDLSVWVGAYNPAEVSDIRQHQTNRVTAQHWYQLNWDPAIERFSVGADEGARYIRLISVDLESDRAVLSQADQTELDRIVSEVTADRQSEAEWKEKANEERQKIIQLVNRCTELGHPKKRYTSGWGSYADFECLICGTRDYSS